MPYLYSPLIATIATHSGVSDCGDVVGISVELVEAARIPRSGYHGCVLISSFTNPLAPLDDACRELATRVCPLFVLKGPRQPFLIGSGIPIQVGRTAVVATAAHVLARIGQASVLTLGHNRS